jgi:outer membrane protein TolC
VVCQRRFLKKEIDTAEAELRMLEGEAQLRQKTLQAKLGPAREDVERVNRLFNVGLTSRLQIAEAQLKLHEIETELAKAGVDLALIQAKLAERRGK